MSKAAEMAKVSAKGGFNLMWGLVISTVISFVGILAITLILGDAKYGLYTIAINVATLIATFRDWGVNSAMVKYSAQYNAEDKSRLRGIIFSGLVFEIALGLSLSVLSFVLSPFISNILHRPTIVPLVQVASFFILAGALMNSATAAFTGLEKMHLYSATLIIQSIVKTGLIIGLLLLGFGTIGAVGAFTVSSLIAGLAGVFLIWTFYRLLPKSTSVREELVLTIKTLLGYGLPVSIGNILTTFLSAFYTLVLGIYVSNNAVIGDYGLAVSFSILITFFATPVTTMLFPAFSKLDYKKDHETLKNVFQYSVKYASLIVVPVTALVMTLAVPGIRTVYQSGYVEAPLYLALLSVPYLYAAIGNLSIGTLLNGQGFTQLSMVLSAIQFAVGVPVGFFLIYEFGVLGLIISSLTVGFPSLFVGLKFIKDKFGVSVDWVSSAKILLSSAMAAVATYAIILAVPLDSFKLAVWKIVLPISIPLQQLVVGVIVFPIIFVLAAVVTRAINGNDINSLNEIAKSLGFVGRILRFLLNVMAKLTAGLYPKKQPEN